MKTGSKKIRGWTISSGIAANSITCEIKNITSFLNSQGEWVALPLNISDILRISVEDGFGKIKRHLLLDVRTTVVTITMLLSIFCNLLHLQILIIILTVSSTNLV
jgi:hypothetical protein